MFDDVGKTLVPACIPRSTEGRKFKCKPVKRSYSFGDDSLPRGENQYLKVVYSASFPPPSVEVCKEGGEHFQAILGSGAPPLELFLLKRKMMGPCWLRVRRPTVREGGALTWCKLEVEVADPKVGGGASHTMPIIAHSPHSP